MAKGLIKLQEELHHRLLNLRSIEAMIRRHQFERLWADSSLADKVTLQEHIDKCNKKKVAEWMRQHPSLELAEKQLVELKRIATKLGMKNISRMGKLELVRLIESKEKEYGNQQSLHA